MAKKNSSFKIPVLYLAFNRLDHVKKTFPEIKKVKINGGDNYISSVKNIDDKTNTIVYRTKILQSFFIKNIRCKNRERCYYKTVCKYKIPMASFRRKQCLDRRKSLD